MIIPLLLAATVARGADADWRKSLDSIGKSAEAAVAGKENSLGGGLSQNEIAKGLKEALGNGVKKAVQSLGKSDGFLKAADVHIPLPEKLRNAERIARKMGLKRQADEFETTLNRAAESAVIEAAPVFADALKKMTLEDARGILQGPEDAATRFFQRTTRTALGGKFLPVVRRATRKAGVTRAYDAFKTETAPFMKFTGQEAPDLDAYVTEKALDALFLRVAAEEKDIRRDPAARATALLKKVFGS
jgi:hypothetical protein